jgi:hypothetical protein
VAVDENSKVVHSGGRRFERARQVAIVKASRQARGRKYAAWAFLACGCAVYEPTLVSDQTSTSAGGTTLGSSGHAGAGGNNSAGSSIDNGNSGSGSDTGSGGTGDIGAAGVGGAEAAGSGAGGSPTGGAAGADGGATACISETDAAFCAREGKDCGTLAGTDNCGNALAAANCGTCQGFAMCGGGGQDHVCGSLTDPLSGGTATASSVGSIGESASKAFDANVNSKWFSGDGNSTGWLAYQFPGTTSHVVTSYSMTSANDVPGRDPADWLLQGSNDGSKWVAVDQRSGQVFATRHQTNSYTCSPAIAYRWFRLLVTANSGALEVQLAELVLYGD